MSDAEPVDWRKAPNPHGLAGIEFLEFATFTDAEQAELKRVFAALGFAETSLHRSKKVIRFNQGDINFILNTEPDCFARSFATVHGVSVCALALRVADAKKAHAFAVKRGAQTYDEGAVGPGELKIPAIRGVYGSLIYYVDLFGEKGSIYDKDFRPNEAAAGAAGRLNPQRPRGLDRACPAHRQVVDFFKDLFGFHTWSHNIIRDPPGAVIARRQQPRRHRPFPDQRIDRHRHRRHPRRHRILRRGHPAHRAADRRPVRRGCRHRGGRAFPAADAGARL